jgi:hypothetical protein
MLTCVLFLTDISSIDLHTFHLVFHHSNIYFIDFKCLLDYQLALFLNVGSYLQLPVEFLIFYNLFLFYELFLDLLEWEPNTSSYIS